jgi:hypothetical protein
MALTEVYTLTFTYQGEVVTYTDYNYSALISLVTSLGITNYDLTSIIEDIIIEPSTDITDYTSGIENTPNTGDNTFLTKQDQYVTNNYVETAVPENIEATAQVAESLTIINQTLVISATSASFDVPIEFQDKIIMQSGGLAVPDPEQNPYIVFGGDNQKIGHIPIISLPDATRTDVLNIDWNLQDPNYYGMKYNGTFELDYTIFRDVTVGSTIQTGRITVHADNWTDNPLVPTLTHDVYYYINETDDPFLNNGVNFEVTSGGTYITLQGINSFGSNGIIKGLYKMY